MKTILGNHEKLEIDKGYKQSYLLGTISALLTAPSYLLV